MTDRNYTCVADAMQSSKKKPLNIGDVFITKQGCKLKVIEYKNNSNVLIEFQDNFKYRKLVRKRHVLDGLIKNPYHKSVVDIGYVGVGRFLTSIKGKATVEYSTWTAMIQRCYSKEIQKKCPTYEDCTVCDEWHNFQNFAEWYTSQEHYELGYEIDKDLLIEGNRIYSPDTCVLAPKELNSLLNKQEKARGKYPIGVCFDRNKNKFLASVRMNGKQVYLGRYENPHEAAEVYQKAKKQYILKKALEWKDQIDERLFDALILRAS